MIVEEQPVRLPLFFVGLIPQGQPKAIINNAKHLNADRFQSRQALKAPPHITIIPPFRLEEEKVRTMVGEVFRHFSSTDGLVVKFGGVSSFEQRTIYLDVLPDPALNAFDLKAKELVANQPELFPNVRFHDAFRPHITLANRDILPESFTQMKHFLETLPYPTESNNLKLEVLHLERGRWERVELK
jgi:2'-5' RNA ligase